MRDILQIARHGIRSGIVLALLLMVSGCGYSLAGRGSSLPATIQTIGIPLFTNATSMYDLEQTLTQRVRLEFISRGKYKVVPEATGTDALLTGTISAVTVAPTAYNENQQAARYAITVIVKVEFRDQKTNKVLYDNPALSFREEYEVTSGSTATDRSQVLSQNSDTLERLANDFARSVVSSILEAF